jgi:hypothetical protein
VQCRNREWVLLPSENDDVFLLRPLTGAMDEVIAIHKRLTDRIGYSLPEDEDIAQHRRAVSDKLAPRIPEQTISVLDRCSSTH